MATNRQIMQHKRFALWDQSNFYFTKTSFMLGTLYDILPASKGIIFERFSWQRESFLNMRMDINNDT